MSARALIADPSVSTSGTVRRYLESAGFEVKVVHGLEEALERISATNPHLVFAAATASFDGETLCKKAKALSPLTSLVLIYPPEETDPEAHATKAGADTFLIGPLKKGSVVTCARTMVRLRSLTSRLARRDAELKKLVEARDAAAAAAAGEKAQGSHSAEFAFFKKFLLMEVKRSRRYKYPVSLLLVSLDGFKAHGDRFSHQQRTAVLAEAFAHVARCTRDIDLSVPFGDERFLIFLPHTGRDGALIVAGRLRDSLSKLKSLPGGTASVGIAPFEPQAQAAQVSFGSLMKDATDALRRAQAAGGNSVEAAGERKTRDRISLT